jgi:hypothetical protein
MVLGKGKKERWKDGKKKGVIPFSLLEKQIHT